MAWALVELLAAVVAMPGRCRTGAPLWAPRSDVGWSLIPGASAAVPTCGPGGTVVARREIRVNALGQRDRPRAYRRAPGRRRVLVLGDSFVEALQVDLEDTFGARVERASGVEMLNAGVSGFATDNELRFFALEGKRYHPDVVLLVLYTGNDVLENGPRLYLENAHGLLPKPWLHSEHASAGLEACLAAHRAAASVASALPLAVWRHSAAARYLLTQGVAAGLGWSCARSAGPPLVEGVPELLGVFGEPRTDAWREAWVVTERLVQELRAEVRAAGATFAVVLAPSLFEVQASAGALRLRYPQLRDRLWDFDYPSRRLGALLDREGIPWLGLLPALRERRAATGQSGYYPTDGHWDERGHAVVAEAARPFIDALLTP